MTSTRPAALIISIALALLFPAIARAVTIDVPADQPTVQAAVAAAALSPDVNNTITISVSPFSTFNAIDIGAAFSATRRLTIRPAANLVRATIVNQAPSVPIISMISAGYVTLQDLDILRNVTNNNDIVYMMLCDHITVERCRIGSNIPQTGTAGWANVRMFYPTEIILRNNILFARSTGTFDYGIDAGNFSDPANSLRLYNNDVSDHKVYGIRIEASVIGALVLLRNNVVVNNVSLVPEPTAYRTQVVVNGPTVVTSHNVAFATGGFVQSGVGQDIAGLASSFLNFTKAQAAPSFVTTAWSSSPPWDDNPDFYRLANLGPLHDGPGDYGMNVGTVGNDIAVVDDIEKDIRPGGAGPHTDRGADQLEPGVRSGAAIPEEPGGLRAVARSGADGGMVVEYSTEAGGRLELRIFDVAGRLLHAAGRDVHADESGKFHWAGGHAHSGVVFSRLELADGSARGPVSLSEKVLLLK